MKAYLFPRDNFMYIVANILPGIYHTYYNGHLTQNVKLETIHSHIHRGNVGGSRGNQVMEADSIEECIKTFNDEVSKVYCRDFLEIVLDDSYSLKLRKETITTLTDELNKLVTPASGANYENAILSL